MKIETAQIPCSVSGNGAAIKLRLAPNRDMMRRGDQDSAAGRARTADHRHL